ncbi:hypothetical protein CKAH01_00752 [Colletotrichum kahawae]|uniref:Uncharacterized protein n=1 Tax=Colletotrichum kahawae TaxID=34407 RepID=A0AAD9YLX6_COLKA|nr:hypothetical protein CKAH01_00752 [Colletotrichum kahawae]
MPNRWKFPGEKKKKKKKSTTFFFHLVPRLPYLKVVSLSWVPVRQRQRIAGLPLQPDLSPRTRLARPHGLWEGRRPRGRSRGTRGVRPPREHLSGLSFGACPNRPLRTGKKQRHRHGQETRPASQPSTIGSKMTWLLSTVAL